LPDAENGENTANTMTDESKVGHKSETQAPQEALARQYIQPRKRGNLQYVRRHPTDLINAGVYKKSAKFKKSLGTKDWQKASRLAWVVHTELEQEWEEKRQELSAQAQKDSLPKKPLSSLSELERKEFIFRQFVRLEKSAATTGWRRYDPTDEHFDALYTAQIDLSAYSGSPNYEPINWDAEVIRLLTAEGIEVSPSAEQSLVNSLSHLLQLAYIESAWRTCSTLEGNIGQVSDRIFSHLGPDTILESRHGAESLEESHTVRELCTAFQEYRKNRVTLATLAKYKMAIRILEDYIGENRKLESIMLADAEGLADGNRFPLSYPRPS
jgi:hypothetical protein